jgi:hypothetical protein
MLYGHKPISERRFHGGMSHTEWQAANQAARDAFLEGKTTLMIPDKFYAMSMDFGIFIQIQACCLLDEEPLGFWVRDSHYGPALKVLCPLGIKSGHKIRIKKKSTSGKSYIAEIVE